MNEEKTRKLAARFVDKEWDELTDFEKRVLKKFVAKQVIARDPKIIYDDRTFGEQIADRVAKFGGSWTFILIFFGILILWVVLNTYVLVNYKDTFDPYPYILLNLFLSMLAALQAPVIMMSQNRQAAKDRLDAQHDYEVNLKAELEILSLHEKLDDLRDQKWIELVKTQQQQIQLLETIASRERAK
jgi:uncharacterized membrane protein